MTTQNIKNQTNNLVEHGKVLVNQGNQRQLVLQSKAGNTLIQSKLTIVAAVTAFLLLTGFISIPLVIIAAVIGMVLGVKVEIRNLD